MAEREVDRAHPDRLRVQAIAAFVSDAGREISPEFHRLLREHDATPRLFAAKDLEAAARTGLEAEIARNIDSGQGVASTEAVCGALLRRGEGYAREQKCQLVADRHPYATIASESVRKACNDGALAATKLILAGQSVPSTNSRIQLSDNLLVQPPSGIGA